MNRRMKEWEREREFFSWLQDSREGQIVDIAGGLFMLFLVGTPAVMFLYCVVWTVCEALGIHLPCWIIGVGRCA